jgi:hypothetical protein
MVRRLAVVLSLLVVAASTSASAAPAAAKRCPTVDLGIRDDPYSAVHDLLAKRTSCRVARRVAAAAAAEDPHPARYQALRFTCTGAEKYGAVDVMRYTCRRHKARVRFSMSPS